MNKQAGVVLIICAIVPWISYASTVNAHFKVTAKVTNGCRFSNSEQINVILPALLPGGKEVSQSANFQLLCTPGMSAQISINDGKHAAKYGGWNLALDNHNQVLIPYRIYYLSDGKKTLWNVPIAFNQEALSKKINMEIDVPQPRSLLQAGHYSDTDIISVSY
ncbi:hypothetical protein BTJ39_03935 [Izhakiella australiensis]|uniref:Spore coat protein U/FanG domain-containing protein n=1 Tax=Izhakiella australiensis TaxID=1926881 RepID=A0A1S8YPR7_9GAMM|nr:spore coat protein U domain-containing protein [Izhakiella australiensis]OON41129.1 hypothetical protein BTJ39_03935 [Izhakiella australiensis]